MPSGNSNTLWAISWPFVRKLLGLEQFNVVVIDIDSIFLEVIPSSENWSPCCVWHVWGELEREPMLRSSKVKEFVSDNWDSKTGVSESGGNLEGRSGRSVDRYDWGVFPTCIWVSLGVIIVLKSHYVVENPAMIIAKMNIRLFIAR